MMNTNMKALSVEELENISGGGDDVKIANRIMLTAVLAAVVIGTGKFANDVYKTCNRTNGLKSFGEALKDGSGLYDRAVYETARLISSKK